MSLATQEAAGADRAILPLFLAARGTATLATHAFTVAIGWQLYELTGSALDLGLLGLFHFLPSLLLLLLVGWVVDRYDRLRVLRICQGFAVVALAALAWAGSQGWLFRELIFGFVFLYASVRCFEMPAQQALLPALVPASRLSRAVAAVSSVQELAAITGPVLGGALCVLGAHYAFGASAALLCVSSALLWRLAGALKGRRAQAPAASPAAPAHSASDVADSAAATARRTLAALFAGFRYVHRHPLLLGAMSLDMLATLLGSVVALLPMIASDILGVGPAALGLLRGSIAAGALMMALVLARRPLQGSVGRLFFLSVGVYGVAVIGFGLSASLLLSMLALALAGAADMISVVVRSSLVQLETPDAMRGRVGSINATFISASNQLGQFRSGLVAAWLGPVGAVVSGGIGTLIVVLLWMRLFPTLLARDRLVQEAPPGPTDDAAR